MSSLNHCIKFELDVKDENIIFKDYFYKSIKLQKHKIYEAELLQPACPFCGSLDLLHNGHLITNIHYPTANASLPVIIRLAKQRVKCRACERWSMAQSELVNKYCSISNASKLKVLSALTEDRSMTSIARENNISINTVQRVLGNCSHRFIDSYEYLPAHLAFDEFKGGDRQLHFICLDGDNHQVVQILRTRYKKTLLKSPWKLYLKKFDELEKVHPHYNWHYKDCLTQTQVVTEGINTNTTLENSYKLMQSFIKAVENGDTQELKSLINCQDQIGTLMHKTLLTFKHNLKAVLNGAALPYSNGCLEGFNREIKQIE